MERKGASDLRRAYVRKGLTLLLTIAVVAVLSGCGLVPQKPEAVFALYRERMKAGNVDKGRELLTEDSKDLAVNLAATYKLQQPPENLSLLNVLDPVSPPLVMKEAETYALLQLRTMKGGLRLIRVVRADQNSPWKVDISEELNLLRVFLETKGALDMIREQAGEYATFWKAFTNQLSRMKPVEPSVEQESDRKLEKLKKKEPKKKSTQK